MKKIFIAIMVAITMMVGMGFCKAYAGTMSNIHKEDADIVEEAMDKYEVICSKIFKGKYVLMNDCMTFVGVTECTNERIYEWFVKMYDVEMNIIREDFVFTSVDDLQTFVDSDVNV